MARAEPPKLPNSSPSLANARVSGKADGTTLVAHDAFELADVARIDHARAERAAARPEVEVPVAQLRSPSRRPCTDCMRASSVGAISALTRSGLMPGGKLKIASTAARFTGGR